MKKITGLFLGALCLIFGGLILTSDTQKIEVNNIMKGDTKTVTDTLTLPSNVCITSESEAKQYLENQSSKTIKPLLTYKYGTTYALNDSGTDIYYCDDPNVSIKKTIGSCVVDGYYTDSALTNRIYPEKIGDVPGFKLQYTKDSNGCVRSIKYITTLYVKCKSDSTVTTTKAPVKTTAKVTTAAPSKDNPSNPETGDMIWLYVGAGILLAAGCGIVFKKLTVK